MPNNTVLPLPSTADTRVSVSCAQLKKIPVSTSEGTRTSFSDVFVNVIVRIPLVGIEKSAEALRLPDVPTKMTARAGLASAARPITIEATLNDGRAMLVLPRC